MGSNPSTIYWMDIFSHIFVVKICNVCLKRLKINEKEAGVGPFKKRKVVQTSSKNTVISNLFNFASQDSSSPFIFSGKLTSRSPPTNQIFEINLSNLNRN